MKKRMHGIPPTKRQQEILDFIKDYIDDYGYPPCRVDICDHFGFSSANAAQDHLNRLKSKGLIEIDRGASRAIRILEVPNVSEIVER